MARLTEEEQLTLDRLTAEISDALIDYRQYDGIDGLKHYTDIIDCVVSDGLFENKDYMSSEYPDEDDDEE